MTNHEIILHLSLGEGIGPVLIQRIIAFCGNNLTDIYKWRSQEWQQSIGVSEIRGAHIVAHLSSVQAVTDELAHVMRVDAQWMSILDQRYPDALRSIHAPPPILYWFGNGDLLCQSDTLAVIGSRAANSYGATIIRALVPYLVQTGFTIISGGALGADSMAHHETLKVKGKTIAVLGSGLLHLYPRTNLKLFQDIIQHGGTIVTSFSMNMVALPANFPARNRIIAGLSRGCIVVQAAEKSGTRITANFALQQGREVFVVPGTFDDPLSAGCHILAREGATLITSAAQICEELGVVCHDTNKQQSFCDIASNKTQKTSGKTYDTATPEDQSLPVQIIHATKNAISIDELAIRLSLEQDVLQQQLWDLQWAGKIQQDFTGRWYSF
jgi:DNA processing protein